MQLAARYQPDSKRDLRIDFFRGAALLVILIDHIEWTTGILWLSKVTPHAFGPADGLDVFVFLSGYVFGIVYEKVRIAKGLWACQRKAMRRAGQLYIANIAIYALLFTGAWILSAQHASIVAQMGLADSTSNPVRSSLYVSILMYQPFGVDILPVYIVILLVMPVLLAIRARHLGVAIGFSLAVYIASQIFPVVNFPIYPPSENGTQLNPFAWQFLFFIGVVLSTSRRNAVLNWLTKRSVVCCSGIVAIVISLLSIGAKLGLPYAWHDVLLWTHKESLGPLRIVYFLSLVNVVCALLPASSTFWQKNSVAPVLWCGQHSLLVFCFGILLTYACIIFSSIARLRNITVACLEIGAVAASIGFSWLLANQPIARIVVPGRNRIEIGAVTRENAPPHSAAPHLIP